ncbi:hypothetical protein ACHAPJ_013020 [Fusarium lateritium]
MFSYNSTGDLLGPQQIRLLHLLPASDINDPIESRLEIVALDQNPVYEALSYCWGDSTQLREIKCNHQEFQVTGSLFSALQHLRNEHSERTLWVDAICINQKDLEERQSQVLLMKDIYTKSNRAVIWLGPDPASDGVNHLFKLIQSNPKLPELQLSPRQRLFLEVNVAERHGWDQDKDKSSSEIPAEQDIVISKEAQKGAVALLKRPWWSRMWTVQEITLAPSAIIMCGNLAASSLDVQQTCAKISMQILNHAFENDDIDTSGETNAVLDDPDGSISIAKLRLFRKSNMTNDLGALLQLHRWLRATDPRDKVYGCLGIAASTYDIKPDYTISTVECYTRAAFNIISGSRSLELFSALRRPSCLETSLTGLPSWVPDWSYDFSSIPVEARGPSSISNHVSRENTHFPILLATRDAFPELKASTSNLSFTPRLLEDGKTLVLKGVIVDELNTVGDILDFPQAGPKASSSNAITNRIRQLKRDSKNWVGIGGVMETIRGWQDLALRTENLQTRPDETRMDAFLTTIFTNRIHLGADRRTVLDHLEQSITTGFEMSRTGIAMNQMHLTHVMPKLYRQILGNRKVNSLYNDIFSFGQAFANIQWAMDQRMATTGSGYLSLVPWPSQPGDRIVLLQGARTPYVLRKAGEKWKILGDCYVHGIMSGEAWSDEKCIDIEII